MEARHWEKGCVVVNSKSWNKYKIMGTVILGNLGNCLDYKHANCDVWKIDFDASNCGRSEHKFDRLAWIVHAKCDVPQTRLFACAEFNQSSCLIG